MRKLTLGLLTLIFCAVMAAPAAAHPIFRRCPADSVKVGDTCVDTYEASAWQIPDSTGVNLPLVKKVQKGKATLADLTAAGAIQLGCTSVPFSHADYPLSFPDNGNWTAPVYAASVPGVLPSTCITWFQAEQSCRLANKRLATNQEWQAAAAGTPDPGTDDEATQCNVDGPPFGPTNTGSRSVCKSSWGAFDMVGNVYEWVADWGPTSTACPGWGGFSDDLMCLSGASTTATAAGALVRGGAWDDDTFAGIFALAGGSDGYTSTADNDIGFRCAR